MDAIAGTARIVVELADGRNLEAFVDSASDGLPLVFHHGTPGSGRPLTGRFPDAEIAALAPHATEFVACIADAVAPGVDAWVDDWRAVVTPWGFDVADVAVPVVLWHGELDDSCPLAHAKWLHDRLPDSRLEIQRGQGHLAIGVSHTREMFDALTTAVDSSRTADDRPAPETRLRDAQ